MSNTQTSFFDSLMSAVRENPLAATLVGGGAIWLLIGNQKIKSVADAAKSAASPIVDAGARNLRAAAAGLERTTAPPTAPDLDQSGSLHLGETLRNAGAAASDAVSGVAGKAAD